MLGQVSATHRTYIYEPHTTQHYTQHNTNYVYTPHTTLHTKYVHKSHSNIYQIYIKYISNIYQIYIKHIYIPCSVPRYPRPCPPWWCPRWCTARGVATAAPLRAPRRCGLPPPHWWWWERPWLWTWWRTWWWWCHQQHYE